jgi:hypothetical protein
MTGPLEPPGEPAAPVPDNPPAPDPQEPNNTGFAPSVFMSDYDFPTGGSVQIPPLPRSDGGLIQSVKASTTAALRDALQGSVSTDTTQKVSVSLDYPLKQIQYPSIWVQFSITKLNRSGVGHEIQIQDKDGNWSFVQEWTFMGRITLTIVALKSLDRDKLSDSVICALAFARPPELLITKPQADTKQNRGLITALDENPYVALTLQLDTIIPGGQTTSMGTPFADDILTYEDSYSFDLVGQFNLAYTNDGTYTLSRIDPAINLGLADQPRFPPEPPPAFGANVDYPVL